MCIGDNVECMLSLSLALVSVAVCELAKRRCLVHGRATLSRCERA
jgi:hypothetical protein